MLHPVLLVAFGGAVGSVCRYGVTLGAAALLGSSFPWGTLAVNVAGSFAMGLFVGWLALFAEGAGALRLLVATGFLGGFTTLSSFSLDAVVLYERGATAAAAAYVLASLVLSIGGVVAGLAIMRSF